MRNFFDKGGRMNTSVPVVDEYFCPLVYTLFAGRIPNSGTSDTYTHKAHHWLNSLDGILISWVGGFHCELKFRAF